MRCPGCAAPDQGGRFCTRCGGRLPVADPPGVSLAKRGRVGPTDPTVLGPGYPGFGSPSPAGPIPPSPPTIPERTRTDRPRRPAAALLIGVTVVALLAAGAGVWFLVRPVGGEEGTAIAPTAAPTAVTTASAGSGAGSSGGGDPTSGLAPPVRPAPVGPGGGKDGADPSSAPATTVTSVQTTTVSVDPMGGDRSDIACGSGYIVQIASELDEPTFRARVATLRANGTLPPDARWTQTSAGCPLFTTQANVYVLYSGPFDTWAAACPDRLGAPPDAFVKPTDPASVGAFLTCLCPADSTALPAITTVGERGVWVGELQRVLGAGLDYDVGPINASAGDPGHWGEYTEPTAAAVGRFQADQGLPVTRQVDVTTWSRLRSARCG